MISVNILLSRNDAHFGRFQQLSFSVISTGARGAKFPIRNKIPKRPIFIFFCINTMVIPVAEKEALKEFF